MGDWGWGIGDWGLGPIPNPQSPIPNPQSPIPIKVLFTKYQLQLNLNKIIYYLYFANINSKILLFLGLIFQLIHSMYLNRIHYHLNIIHIIDEILYY